MACSPWPSAAPATRCLPLLVPSSTRPRRAWRCRTPAPSGRYSSLLEARVRPLGRRFRSLVLPDRLVALGQRDLLALSAQRGRLEPRLRCLGLLGRPAATVLKARLALLAAPAQPAPLARLGPPGPPLLSLAPLAPLARLGRLAPTLLLPVRLAPLVPLALRAFRVSPAPLDRLDLLARPAPQAPQAPLALPRMSLAPPGRLVPLDPLDRPAPPRMLLAPLARLAPLVPRAPRRLSLAPLGLPGRPASRAHRASLAPRAQVTRLLHPAPR